MYFLWGGCSFCRLFPCTKAVDLTETLDLHLKEFYSALKESINYSAVGINSSDFLPFALGGLVGFILFEGISMFIRAKIVKDSPQDHNLKTLYQAFKDDLTQTNPNLPDEMCLFCFDLKEYLNYSLKFKLGLSKLRDVYCDLLIAGSVGCYFLCDLVFLDLEVISSVLEVVSFSTLIMAVNFVQGFCCALAMFYGKGIIFSDKYHSSKSF